ncbi:hypothetical protein EV424DRAFT_1473594 [Suillus variegatus]|nr:hypothetical protein EV424DRAFT_1473594 [Suillus variegatus]
MSDDENQAGGPSHKWTSSNPLVLHGRHFGWTVFSLCNFPALLIAGVLQLEGLQDSPIEDYPAEVFMELIESYPGLLARLTDGEEEDIIHIGELLGDNTKTLKSTVLEWLMPRGQPLIPPLSQNIKLDRGFNHEVTSRLLCPAGLDWLHTETKQSLKSGKTAVHGDQWPMFLYTGYHYDPDEPWKGLLRSEILIFGFKHVFMSPSSIDKEPKATRSGNTYLHGMKSVTKGSLAYIAMQIRFSLTLSSVFSHTDMIMDSENFYHSILDLLENPDEIEEVANLMMWWTHRVFPNSSSLQHCISKNSALSKIREKCAALRQLATADTN